MAIVLAPAVTAALTEQRPVVALESTLICHGMPRPMNAALAGEIEDAVRAEGAVPATIAIRAGAVVVGLDGAGLAELAAAEGVTKCTTRDLPMAIASGDWGATTVAATTFVAARVGIQVMATGGLGGVHLGGESSLDVSADLDELARSPVVVVCSGIKSVLDRPRTLERLETLGVPVVGFGCAELPGFHSRETGLAIPRLDDMAALCRMWRAHRALGLPGGVVVANPPPTAEALPASVVDGWVTEARAAAQEAGVTGPAETPFLLQRMASSSEGATVRVNRSLILANARLAAGAACALAARAAAEGPTDLTQHGISLQHF